MVHVDLDDGLYERVKEVVDGDRVKWPSYRHFINIAVSEKLELRK